MISLRHVFCGMSAVRFAALRAPLTHFLYLLWVWPLRVHPQLLWIISRACSMTAKFEHFALTHAPNVLGTETWNTNDVTAAAMSQHMVGSPFCSTCLERPGVDAPWTALSPSPQRAVNPIREISNDESANPCHREGSAAPGHLGWLRRVGHSEPAGLVTLSLPLPIGFLAGLRSPRLAGRRDRGRPFFATVP